MRISQVLSRQESTRFMLYDRPVRKRVAVINTGGILLSYGGASPFMRNLDPFLKQAYELSYFSLPNSLQSVRWVPHRLLFLLYLFFQCRKLKQFDFIISHVPEGSFVVSFLRVPYLHIFHGNANPMTLSRFWFGKYFAGIFQRMERRIVRTAKLMYTVGKPRVDIPKILNPIFHCIRIKPIDQRSGFIFAGRLEKMKQVDRIIRAYSQLSPEIIHKHPLYIAGSGSQYASLRSLADQLNIRQHVIFQGNLDNATLLEECSRRSVLLMASSQEGFPMAIAEAFSLGVPVVATDVGDISTFLVNQFNGILLPVSFRDEEYIAAIGSILKTYVDYSANALASAAVFRADKVAESIIRDINQVIDPSK